MTISPPREMSRHLVTGCAGFLGSHLSERLVAESHEVIGVDCFTSYYARATKELNLERLRDEPRFHLLELDLAGDSLDGLLEGVDCIFHLAAQAGVRGSFGERFAGYVRNNVVATQRLLEQAVLARPTAFVYASSSSVYGDAARYPTTELAERRPVSPYGMTKVSTEELAGVYLRCFAVPAVGLRYFTAYGPRQRPDMAFSTFFSRVLAGQPVPLNGDGRQVRDFTFVDDVVEGTVCAARHGRAGAVYNIGGGAPVRLLDALGLIGELTGLPVEIEPRECPLGDARRTGCDGELARTELGFDPSTELRDGLAAQLEWMLAGQHGQRRPVAA
ncbi:MAG TPA: NAD-dependent epimerase/dehydratase family protein [Candidatus Dormibacteraeota bacterium]|nr:NAD-dependent epimerase/dehydratase family protein [Candidatus Dormibacteraeota bacterium]